MKDGKASGSRTYFLADAKNSLGKKARERQLNLVIKQLAQAEVDLATAKAQELSH